MADDDVTVRLRAIGAAKFNRDMKSGSRGVHQVGEEAQDAERKARRAGKGFAVFGTRMKGVGGMSMRVGGMFRVGMGSAIAAAGGIATLSKVVRDAGSEYSEAARVGGQTNAVLRSTKGVANVTAGGLERLASRLSDMAGVDDEVIQAGGNMLLTFKGVRNETGKGNKVFDRATEAALDMAKATGKDVTGAALSVGKALNDPAKGLSKLSKQGVTFTDQQKKQVEALVASGDTLGAQKIILRELEGEFKGSARAQRQPIDQLRVGYGNLMESLGKLGAPFVNAGISKVAKTVGRLNRVIGPIFERKDLSLGEKLKLSGAAAEKILEPLVAAGRKQVAAMHLDQKLEQAIQWATPQMAAAAERAAPPVARAFVTGFKAAPVWAQLLTVGLISKRLGVFGIVGKLAAGRMAAAYANQFPNSIGARRGKVKTAMTSVGATAGRSAGQTAAAYTAGEAAGKLPGSINARKSRFATAGGILGKAMGVAAVGALGFELVQFLTKANDKAAEAGGVLGAAGKLSQLGEEITKLLPNTRGIVDAASLLDGGKARGGPVTAGKSYMVGENSPEIFTPRSSGRITPIPPPTLSPTSGGDGGTRTVREQPIELALDGQVFYRAMSRRTSDKLARR